MPKPQEAVQKKMTTDELSQIREELGFNDIPVDALDDRTMKEIFLAWSKQRLGASGKKQGVRQLLNGKKFRQWKDDLKWALEADLEDEDMSTKARRDRTLSIDKSSLSIDGAASTTKGSLTQTQPKTPPRPLGRVDGSVEPRPPAQSVEININFGSLPKLSKLPDFTVVKKTVRKIKGFHWTRLRIIGASATVSVLLILLATPKVLPLLIHKNDTQTQTKTRKAIEAPNYATVMPDGKTVNDFGGWKRVSPADRDPVFAYSDKIDDVQISVSQQKLPDSFHPDVDQQVAELAKSFSATDKFDAGGTSVYVGTSAKGPQSVILVKNDTLILIKSQSKITDKSWGAYVETLK